MKRTLLVLVLTMSAGFGWAQALHKNPYSFSLNGNAVTTTADFQQQRKRLSAEATKVSTETRYFIMQFNTIPTKYEQEMLKTQGITLLDYLQGNAYYVAVSPKFFSIRAEAASNIRALLPIKPEYKVDRDLFADNIPDYAKGSKGLIKVIVTYFEPADEAIITDELALVKAQSVKIVKEFHQVSLEIPASEVMSLATISWVKNIDLVDPPQEYDNKEGRSLHRANVLNSSLRGLGYGLTGKGVKIGLWDGNVDRHRDFGDRIIRREFEMQTTDHGTHTCGTITSAGILNPRARGMAPEATVYAWNFNTQSNGLNNAQERLDCIQKDGIELTSNSFGSKVTTCPHTYKYSTSDFNEDLISTWFPSFLFVYSAGNDQTACPGGFRTTSKNIKNSLLVAAVDRSNNMSDFSSFGPSSDGRLIPNISGDGVDVYSTFLNNTYGYMDGTSMATPGVAGTMALIYQRYKETHAGEQPLSSLLRALACNTATDLGNPGPDYKFGYGAINGLRAVEVMEQKNYMVGSVAQGETFTKQITIPAGAVALKVMLAWTDVPGTPGAAKILVNDLDLKVAGNGAETLPWVLNPTSPAAIATHGVDNMNNMEQVTIDNPAAGTYTVSVNGTTIPEDAQQFSVVYDVVMPTLRLTYPLGGELLAPEAEEVIHWDCEGYKEPVTIEYSSDNGVNYSIIATVPAAERAYVWTVPAGVNVAKAKIRISNGSTFSENKAAFSIMPVPQNVALAQVQCGSGATLAMTWDAIANAKYEVLKLKGQVYEHLADVETNSHNVTIEPNSNDNYFCVRAIDITTGAVSERSLAVTANPSVALTALPFKEDFEQQKATNFTFMTTPGYGKASVQYVNNSQQYGIRLEGAPASATGWTAGVDAACFTNNPKFITKATICNLDASAYAGKKLRLKFDYRQKYLTAAGTSYFRVKVNGDYLTNTDGKQIYGATSTINYNTVYYDLSAYAGNPSVTIEFEAVCKSSYVTYVNSSGNYDYSSDSNDKGDFVTIDNVEILEPMTDISIVDLTPGTGVTNSETITVTVQNLSGVDAVNIPVNYQINGGTAVEEVIAGPVAPLAEATYNFTQKADFSTEGEYTIDAKVAYANDQVADNNTATANISNDATSVKIGIATGTVASCSATFTDKGGRFSDYPSSQTSTLTFKPDAADKQSKVIFTEFDTEKDYDFLYVYDGPTTASALLGKFSGTTVPPSFTSSAPGGELTFKFTSDAVINGTGWIASISCVDKPAVDVAVTAITAPTASSIKTATETVTATFINNGVGDLTNIDVYYQIGTNTPVKESIASLAKSASVAYSFTTKADLSVAGDYTLKVWADAPGDVVPDNSTKSTTITSIAVLNDVGISAISSIVPARVGLSTVSATVKNYGTVPASNINVAYKVDGGAEVSQVVAGPIAAGATAAVTFTTKANFNSANTTYNVEVYTVDADALADNNKMTAQVVTPANATTNRVGTFSTGNSIATSTNTTQFSLTSNFTVEMWLKPNKNPKYGTLFSKGFSIIHHSEYYPAVYGTNVLIVSIGGQTFLTPSNSITNDVWQHVAVTSAADGTIKVYINGVEQTLSNSTKAIQAANLPNPVRLGSNSTFSQPYYGAMDEVRIWNSCLDQATISTNMTMNYAANTAGLLAYYKFIEESGNYVYDYSSNDNTALVANADVTGMGAGKFWNQPGALLEKVSMVNEKIPTKFDANTNTYTAVMDGADLTSVVAKFSAVMNSVVKVGANQQTSNVTTNDFSAGLPLTYTAEGVGFNAGITQNYSVSVTNDLSSACDLTAVSFEVGDNPSLSEQIALVQDGNNFSKKLAQGTNVSALKARFSVSPNAKVIIGGAAYTDPQVVNYTKPVMVRVVAQNGRVFKNYAVVLDARSAQAELVNFAIPGEQVGTSVINPANHTVAVWVKKNTNKAALTPTFTVSNNANMYVNSITQSTGTTTNDFSSTLVYTVVSEDEATSTDWNITVTNDDVKPTITLSGNAAITVAHGSTYTDAGATASDNAEGDITSSIAVTGTVNTSAIGTYTLTYNVTDAAGNVAEPVTRTVSVTDQTKPVIALVGNATMSIVKGASFTDPGVTASDNVDGDISSKVVATGTVNTSVIGSYTITYNVSDAAGNAAEAITRTVTVTTNTGVGDNDNTSISIYSDGTFVYVNIPELVGTANLTICNAIGNSIFQTTDLSQGLNRLTGNLISGMFIVKLEANGQTYSTKVVIK